MTPETCTTSNTQRTDRDETANVTALLPCPFCGGNGLAEGASHDYISVWCDCGAHGPGVPFPDDCDPVPPILECYAAWNRRAAPTLPADVKGLVERLSYRVGNPSAWEAYEEAASEMLREAAAALTAQAALLAEFVAVTKPFVLIANIEDSIGTKAGESIMVNVDLCRAASRLIADMEG